jgi:ubiquitin-activating enzyme E1
VQSCENVNLYLGNSTFVQDQMRQAGNHKELFETILNFLVNEKPLSFEECISWARLKFEE